MVGGRKQPTHRQRDRIRSRRPMIQDTRKPKIDKTTIPTSKLSAS
jgi:hypothetical protein